MPTVKKLKKGGFEIAANSLSTKKSSPHSNPARSAAPSRLAEQLQRLALQQQNNKKTPSTESTATSPKPKQKGGKAKTTPSASFSTALRGQDSGKNKKK